MIMHLEMRTKNGPSHPDDDSAAAAAAAAAAADDDDDDDNDDCDYSCTLFFWTVFSFLLWLD